MGKNYKNINFNKKEDYLYALNTLVTIAYKNLKKYKEYKIELDRFIEAQNEEYIDAYAFDSLSDKIHYVNNELIKCFVDDTSTGFSYTMFRRLIERTEYKLNKLDDEVKAILEKLRDIRNWTFHLAQSDFIARKEVFKKSIPSEFQDMMIYVFAPIKIGIADKVSLAFVVSLALFTDKRYKCFNTIFQHMMKDYETLIGHETYIQEIKEKPIELIDERTAAVELSRAMQQRKYNGSMEAFETITLLKPNSEGNFELKYNE